MQHLSPQICKRLEKLGLTSKNDMWYGNGKWSTAFTISDILLNADNARKLWGEAKVCPNCGKPDIKYKRYDDFTSGEIEMIGECLQCHHQPQEDYFGVEPAYVWHTTRLKNIVLYGADIEPHLLEAIESK